MFLAQTLHRRAGFPLPHAGPQLPAFGGVQFSCFWLKLCTVVLLCRCDLRCRSCRLLSERSALFLTQTLHRSAGLPLPHPAPQLPTFVGVQCSCFWLKLCTVVLVCRCDLSCRGCRLLFERRTLFLSPILRSCAGKPPLPAPCTPFRSSTMSFAVGLFPPFPFPPPVRRLLHPDAGCDSVGLPRGVGAGGRAPGRTTGHEACLPSVFCARP